MRVSYEEGLANYFGLRRRSDEGNNIALSVRAGGSVGQLIELRNQVLHVPTVSCASGRQHQLYRQGEDSLGMAESKSLCMRGKFQTREPGSPICPWGHVAMTHDQGGQRTSPREILV
ncbi:hypothetical protein Poly21_14050 [Allorhodopirellula heiligendammensis]|uniref:Uncharacterized protein n=1 Tax=Allorhodopirellula heiligendammensis TaxID=2714739 RepID=A0A5C6C7E2_9BACT|nr:hypothetical protein Poly21_14050 [Allorhodopirellula heiligendammensis]